METLTLESKKNTAFRSGEHLKILAGFFVLLVICTILSYAADSVTVAKVQTASSQRGVLQHILQKEGTLQPVSENALTLPSGLKIQEVLVREGSSVQAGDSLILFEKEAADAQIHSIEADIQTLKAQKEFQSISDQLTLSGIQNSVKQAEEDVKAAETDAARKVLEAEKELADAQAGLKKAEEKLEQVQVNAPEDQIRQLQENNVSAQESLAAAQLAYTETEKSADRTLSDARNQLRQAEKAMRDALTPIPGENGEVPIIDLAPLQLAVTQANQAVKRADEDRALRLEQAKLTLDAAQRKADQAQEELNTASSSDLPDIQTAQSALEAARQLAESKSSGVDAARINGELQIQTAMRALEAARETARKQSSNQPLTSAQLQKQQVEIEEKQKMLNALQKLVESNYTLTAPHAGSVEKCAAVSGQTTDGLPIVTLSTSDQGWIFECSVSSKEAKMLAEGEKVMISWTYQNQEQRQEFSISELSPPNEEGNSTVRVKMTDVKCRNGQSAKLNYTATSVNYDSILPLSALRTDQQGDFILLLTSSVGVLGKSYTAERLAVTVLDKNTEKMAVEGAFSSDDAIVISASRNISAGDRARLAS